MTFLVVSQRVDYLAERQERRDALDQRLVEWVSEAGFIAVPVPNSLQTPDLMKLLNLINPSGIILSGGNDIGAEPTRDATEGHLLSYALKKKLPVLGLCRGMQFLAMSAGGKLVRGSGHVATRHSLGTSLEMEEDIPMDVNSYHEWVIERVPDGYCEVATCEEDATIEAIRHEALPWEGWMWHPERETTFAEIDIRRLKNLMNRA